MGRVGAALIGVALLVGVPSVHADSAPGPVVATFAGNGRAGLAGDGGDRREASLIGPVALAAGPSRQVLYLDAGRERGGRVRSIDIDSGAMQSVAGGGSLEVEGVPALEARLGARPRGLAVNSRGDVYIGYEGVGRVDRIDARSGRIARFAGGGASLEDGIAALDLELRQPWQVRVDAEDRLYVMDAALHAVFLIDADGRRVQRVAGVAGRSGYAGDGGPATAALLNAPSDVAVDDRGNLFVTDRDNHVIRRIDAATGVIDTFAGTGGVPGFAGDGGDRRAAAFRYPQALLLDGRQLLVADRLNHRLRSIDLDSGRVDTWAGSGRAGHAGENVPAHEAGLFEPMSMLRLEGGDVLAAALRARRIYSIGAPFVLPVPWWRSGWALAAFALGLAVLAITVVRTRTRRLRVHTLALERAVTERSRELAREEEVIRRQAAELETRLDAKDRLLARVSHEFRTPLAVILGPTRRLRDSAAGPEIRESLRSIEQRANRLLRLVEQLLNVARLSHGYRGAAGVVPAVPIVRRIVAAHESRAVERGQRLRLGRLDEVAVHSSVVALEAVIGQLLSEAIERTAAGGEITASVMETGDEVRIAVAVDRSDDGATGAEEPPEARELDDVVAGLPLIAHLVTAQGGSVAREAVAGRGSIVTVTLPKAAASQDKERAVAATEPGPAPSPDAGTLPRATVLVIEDNPDLCDYLAELLAREHRCVTASDGERGLSLAREVVPDLVVCDVMLPGCDGFEVCRTLKGDEVTCHIPVVLLTALDGEQHRLHGLEDGADDYLAKPFEDDVLRARVAGLLEIRALLRRRYVQELQVEREAAGPGARDRAFLERLSGVVEARHADASFELTELAARLAMSERQLQRKMRALLGVTPAEYVRGVRLQRARSRLLAGERPSDVAIAVGFGSHAYFATCFRAEFGHPPGDVRRQAEDVAPAKDPVAPSKTSS